MQNVSKINEMKFTVDEFVQFMRNNNNDDIVIAVTREWKDGMSLVFQALKPFTHFKETEEHEYYHSPNNIPSPNSTFYNVTITDADKYLSATKALELHEQINGNFKDNEKISFTALDKFTESQGYHLLAY